MENILELYTKSKRQNIIEELDSCYYTILKTLYLTEYEKSLNRIKEIILELYSSTEHYFGQFGFEVPKFNKVVKYDDWSLMTTKYLNIDKIEFDRLNDVFFMHSKDLDVRFKMSIYEIKRMFVDLDESIKTSLDGLLQDLKKEKSTIKKNISKMNQRIDEIDEHSEKIQTAIQTL